MPSNQLPADWKHQAGQAIKHSLNAANASGSITSASVNKIYSSIMGGTINTLQSNMANSFYVDEAERYAVPQIKHPTEGLGRFVAPGRMMWDKMHNALLSKLHKAWERGVKAADGAQMAAYRQQVYYSATPFNPTSAMPNGTIQGINTQIQQGVNSANQAIGMGAISPAGQGLSAAAQTNPNGVLGGNIAMLRNAILGHPGSSA